MGVGHAVSRGAVRSAPVRVVRGSPADGTAIGDLALGENIWISLVSRAGEQVPVRRDTVLAAGDEVLALTDTGDGGANPVEVFGRTLSRGHL